MAVTWVTADVQSLSVLMLRHRFICCSIADADVTASLHLQAPLEVARDNPFLPLKRLDAYHVRDHKGN